MGCLEGVWLRHNSAVFFFVVFFFSFLICIMFWERVMSFCIIIPALSQAHINLNLYGIRLLCL